MINVTYHDKCHIHGHQRRICDAWHQQGMLQVTYEWVITRASVATKDEFVTLEINKTRITSRMNELRHVPPWTTKTSWWSSTSTRYESHHVSMSYVTYLCGHKRRVCDARDWQDMGHITDEWDVSHTSMATKDEFVTLEIDKTWVASHMNELRHVPPWPQRRVADTWDQKNMSHITCEWVPSSTSAATKDEFLTLEIDQTQVASQMNELRHVPPWTTKTSWWSSRYEITSHVNALRHVTLWTHKTVSWRSR